MMYSLLRFMLTFWLNCPAFYQSQLADFRAYEGQDMYTGEKIIPIKVLNNTKHVLSSSSSSLSCQ